MPTAIMEWKAYADEQPVLGSRCLIALAGRRPSEPVVDCQFHNLATFEAEYGPLHFGLSALHDTEFFVETGDESEWWEAKHVLYWAELFPRPEIEGEHSDE